MQQQSEQQLEFSSLYVNVQQTVSAEPDSMNVLCFEGRIIAMATGQLCGCRSKAAINNRQINGHSYRFHKTLLKSKAIRCFGLADYNLQTSALQQ